MSDLTMTEEEIRKIMQEAEGNIAEYGCDSPLNMKEVSLEDLEEEFRETLLRLEGEEERGEEEKDNAAEKVPLRKRRIADIKYEAIHGTISISSEVLGDVEQRAEGEVDEETSLSVEDLEARSIGMHETAALSIYMCSLTKLLYFRETYFICRCCL
jgi:hypothetical protein